MAVHPPDIVERRLREVWDDNWPGHVKAMMRELARIGVELEQVSARRTHLFDRRHELYQALDGLVLHRVVAAVAGSTKGAVDQALTKARKDGGER